MPTMKRHPTPYPGVFFLWGRAVGSGKPEKIYYVKYRKAGKAIEEKGGRQYQDAMTPAKAAGLRVRRIQGDLSNKERREVEREIPKQRWTIGKLFDEWQASNPHLKGLPQDRSHFKHIEVLADKEPQEITPLEVDHIKNEILKTKSPQTCKLALSLLRRIVRWGVKKNLSQPLSFAIEFPQVNNTVTEFLTPKQISRLLEVIDSEPENPGGAMMKVALFSGLRRGELFRLTWNDVDFKRGFIHIRNPKGGRDQVIPLNPETAKVFQRQPQTDSPYIFPGLNGNQRAEVRRAVNRIKRDAGLPDDFRPLHGLRHTFASMLASSGEVDLYTLQHLLTHKDPGTTQRYAHLRDESLRRASNLVGNLVNQALIAKDALRGKGDGKEN
ncbi:MAG: site-specific integrase [Pseudomonadota bacterium]